MAKKKKGELKLIMPKHSSSVDHFRLALKVCLAHPSGIGINDFKDELFDELHAEGIEDSKNSDGSHYTKCLQLPRYFGMVRYCLSGERANAITKRGREMYNALNRDPIDKPMIWNLISKAILKKTFGRNNEGCGSESYCEPFAIFFRAMKDLEGIAKSEYGYLVQELDKGRPYKKIIAEIVAQRTHGGVHNPTQSQASNIEDWKVMLFLQNLEFLEHDAFGRMKLTEEIARLYGEALYSLPLYSPGYKRQLFMKWMEAKGLGQSVDNYSESIAAVSEEMSVKTSGVFPGFYQVLTGSKPARNIYDVNGLSDFNTLYSQLNAFWEIPIESAPGPFDEDGFYECYYYARGPKNIDNHRLLNSYVQYKEFLGWWDENKADFVVDDFQDSHKETAMVNGELGPLQKISYGAPGTGKSHDVNAITKLMPRKDVVRTTFHPDSDYSTFVGAYKPKMTELPRVAMEGITVKKATFDTGLSDDEKASLEKEKKISYEFVPQAFAKTYVRAWGRFAEGKSARKMVPNGNPSGIDGKMKAAVDALIAEHNGEVGFEVSKADVVAKFASVPGGAEIAEGSIIPTDYCYNRINNGIPDDKPTYFEYVSENVYKCFGAGYKYNGPVKHHAATASEEEIVGYCVDGIRVIGGALPVMLVVEEINRGDCAKVFGDLFQLLDRRVKDDIQDPTKKEGFSEYPVLADADLADYIRGKLTDTEKSAIRDAGYASVVADENLELILPPNMYIWATMNTSDQSLFPMDSAFKRRWDWKYVPIKDEKKGWKIKFTVPAEEGTQEKHCEYDWWNFLEKVNEVVEDVTSSEDKKLGYFFVKTADGIVTADMLVNKVFFFLWNDVFKDVSGESRLQMTVEGKAKDIKFHQFFKNDGTINLKLIDEFLGEKLKVKVPEVQNPAPAGEAAAAAEPEVEEDAVAAEADAEVEPAEEPEANA